MKKIYIAGPMTGLPEFNRPAILPDGLQHHEYMEICLPMVRVADAVFMMKGWENSKGANMEHDYAKDIGLEIIYEC
ncbi:TPA: DUF4406 domain-containing protein [Vibrio cholerae]